jgi:RNA polymerase sigma-70 factor (ECF subfamily)
MNESEDVLVAKARGGDHPAFEELVRRTARMLFARIYLETGDTHQAEDLVQETLLRAYKSLDRLQDVREFRPWLLKIAQNVAIDAARTASRKKRSAPSLRVAQMDGLPADAADPHEAVDREEVRQQVLSVLRSMPEEYRLPLTLRYIGGADYETICTQLGLTNGSLRGLLHRGLRLMRARMPRELVEQHVGVDSGPQGQG